MKTVTVEEAARTFISMVDDIVRSGEEVVLMSGDQKIARVVPEVPEQTALEIFQDLEGILSEESAEAITAALAQAREGHRLDELRNPWVT